MVQVWSTMIEYFFFSTHSCSSVIPHLREKLSNLVKNFYLYSKLNLILLFVSFCQCFHNHFYPMVTFYYMKHTLSNTQMTSQYLDDISILRWHINLIDYLMQSCHPRHVESININVHTCPPQHAHDGVPITFLDALFKHHLVRKSNPALSWVQTGKNTGSAGHVLSLISLFQNFTSTVCLLNGHFT